MRAVDTSYIPEPPGFNWSKTVEANELATRIRAVQEQIEKTLGFLQQLPTGRETVMVKTKLDEAQLWLERYAYLNQG
jgi:hypothetical protein